MSESRTLFLHIKRCQDVTDRDLAAALVDRETARALLDRMAKVSRPGEGAPKVLVVIARLARDEVEWIDGMLRVELAHSGEATTVDVLSDLGVGMRERVFPSFRVSAPLDEFTRLAESAPRSIEPLAIRSKSARKLVLRALWQDDDDKASVLPPPVAIADDSLYARTDGGAQGKRGSKRPSMPKVGRRSSQPDAEEARPQAIPTRSGKTLRPPGTMSTPPRGRTSTLRPEKGVPPPRPSVTNLRVPRAGAIPRGEPVSKPKRRSPPRISRPVEIPAVETKPTRARPVIPRSEPPDEEAIDEGWKDSER